MTSSKGNKYLDTAIYIGVLIFFVYVLLFQLVALRGCRFYTYSTFRVNLVTSKNICFDLSTRCIYILASRVVTAPKGFVLVRYPGLNILVGRRYLIKCRRNTGLLLHDRVSKVDFRLLINPVSLKNHPNTIGVMSDSLHCQVGDTLRVFMRDLHSHCRHSIRSLLH